MALTLIKVLVAPTMAALIVVLFRLITRNRLSSSTQDWQIGFDLVAAALMLLAILWIDAYAGIGAREDRITGLSVQIFDALQPSLRSDDGWYHAAISHARESCGQILADPRLLNRRIYGSDVVALSEYVDALGPSEAIVAGSCADLTEAHDSLSRHRAVQWAAPVLIIVFLVSTWGMTFFLRQFAPTDNSSGSAARSRVRIVGFWAPILAGYVMLGAAVGLSNVG